MTPLVAAQSMATQWSFDTHQWHQETNSGTKHQQYGHSINQQQQQEQHNYYNSQYYPQHHYHKQHTRQHTSKWDINLPSTPLTQHRKPYYPETSTLLWFLNVPQGAYIAVVEEVCSSLPHKEAEELRSEISRAFRNFCPLPKHNISLEEFKAIKELREDSSRVILTADKGLTMVLYRFLILL